jgi:NSS family neurotransmitter:Na+ symporter
MERERLGSRLGFILLSAGCAIGIGNVWKFPYMVGEYGGGIFVLIYLFFLIALGVPVLTIEFSLGRASQKSPAKLYQQLEPKGSKWHIHGYVAVVGNYILMMFYTSVAGWMLHYFVATAGGKFRGLDAKGISGYFDNFMLDAKTVTIYMLIVVVIGFCDKFLWASKWLGKNHKVYDVGIVSNYGGSCNQQFLYGRRRKRTCLLFVA